MALSPYEQALADLGADAPRDVERVFKTWSTDATLGQVRKNIADETALARADFSSLMNSFVAQLTRGSSPTDSWLAACRTHKLKGRRIPEANCPVIFGRAKGLEDHAASIAKASRGRGDLTKEQAKKLLLKYSGSPNPLELVSFLREAPLGNYFVWATFNPDDPRADPFDRLPSSHGGICTALGLGGHLTTGNTLIVLIWNHRASGSPPVHRPTVAEAEIYPYYRPRPDADAPWGLTQPLPPNLLGLLPQPEVVMPETTGQGLRLPFRVVQA